MFYYILFRSSLWKSLEDKNRNIRIALLGSTFYIILHSYVYSKYVDSTDFVKKYRNFIYLIIFVDIAFTVITLKKNYNKKKEKKNKNKINQLLLQQMMQYGSKLSQQPPNHQYQYMNPTIQQFSPVQQIYPFQQSVQSIQFAQPTSNFNASSKSKSKSKTRTTEAFGSSTINTNTNTNPTMNSYNGNPIYENISENASVLDIPIYTSKNL